MLQRLLLGLSAAAALAVLVVLVDKTRSEPQSLPAHLARVGAIQDIAAANRRLEDEVARARLELEAEPPSLAAALEEFDAALAALAKASAGAPAVALEVAVAFGTVKDQATQRSKQAVDYRARTRHASPDYARLRAAGEAVLADLTLAREPETRLRVTELLEGLTRYAVTASSGNRGTLEKQIASIGAGTDPREPAASAKLARLGEAAGTFLGNRERVRAAGTAFAAIPMSRAIDDLHTTYYAQYAQQEATLARYRLALAGYAAALLVVFGIFAWRLRVSYAELRVLNTGLESAVQARTSELRKALEDLRLQQAHLIQSEKMAALGQMVAGVAHEINTPLGYARGNVETIRESIPRMQAVYDAYRACLSAGPGALTDEARVRLGSALREWDPVEGLAEAEVLLGDAEHGFAQISELVMSLKNFSRLDRSFDERFDVNEGLESSLKICHGHLKHRVTVRRAFAELPEIPCAPSQLNQVFLNLITNAAQAIEGEGTIDIATRDRGSHVEIEIRDSGCGMDAETLKHIYEPFFTTKAVGKGTGLGLSIVYRIIEDHHGRIEAQSTPGEGTTFTLSLPKQPPARKAQQRTAHAAPAPTEDEGLLAEAVS